MSREEVKSKRLKRRVSDGREQFRRAIWRCQKEAERKTDLLKVSLVHEFVRIRKSVEQLINPVPNQEALCLEGLREGGPEGGAKEGENVGVTVLSCDFNSIK